MFWTRVELSGLAGRVQAFWAGSRSAGRKLLLSQKPRLNSTLTPRLSEADEGSVGKMGRPAKTTRAQSEVCCFGRGLRYLNRGLRFSAE